MQEHTISDRGIEKKFREFIHAEDRERLEKRLSQMQEVAIKDPRTISIVQRIINQNDPCPCGSGKKFKFCCRCKVNKGSFEVESGAKK